MRYRTDSLSHYLPMCHTLSCPLNRLPCGVDIYYRLDGTLFKLIRFKAKTKVTKSAVIDLQYADDRAILTHTVASHKP